ncbi:RNA 2',3'-cyclic phosphodiesterase [Pendulispora brunnea]|uniref:RNA 2',3'-cyclic phosphodiesterase n=1 Tax=Pendulispora brunnea TaxID=2905690 RepID=A0ABZ2KFT5_9BACT
MRAFVALDLDPATRARFAEPLATLRQSRSVRCVDPERMHLTVKFLGDISEEQASAVAQALQFLEAQAGPRIHQATFTGFPQLRRARVLAFELADDGTCAHLASLVETALEPLGFPREGRLFRPHVTLARCRQPIDALTFRDFSVAPIALEATWTELTLYRSHLTPPPPRYEPIHRVSLGAPRLAPPSH